MKKILAVGLGIIMFSSGLTGVCAKDSVIEIHVAVNGNSSGIGTQDSPLDSLESARRAVERKKKSNPDTPINVIFHGGTYRFDKSVSFNESDSGTPKGPVTYMSAEGEDVYFKGSEVIDLTKIKPVEDAVILGKLPRTSRGKVGYIDLKEQGLTDLGKIPKGYSMYSPETSYEGAEIFLNGKQQSMARWPNGKDSYAQMAGVISKGGIGETGEGGVFETEDYRLMHWTDAKEAYIAGFFDYDWAYDRIKVKSIDPTKKQISLSNGSSYGLSMSYSHRWAIINLLEELDMPGEWYIDHDENILYYYTERSLKNSVMEITTLKDDLIRLNGVKDINFKGITFSQASGCAIRAYDKVENMTVSDCVFENIGRYGIYHFATKQSTIAANTTQASQFRENGMENVHIDNNAFYNNGERAVYIQCGSRDANIPSNCSVNNNYFYEIGTANRVSRCLNVQGVGIEVKNNTIHESGYGISFIGADIVVANNEVYNVMKHLNDGSAIYTGRNFINRNNKVYHNYIHDVRAKNEMIKTDYSHGIYLDDMDSGTEVYENIIVKANNGVLINCGMSNNVHDNILVDCDKQAVQISTYQMGSPISLERNEKQAKAALQYPGYQRYPDIKEDLESGMLTLPARNTVADNVAYNSDTTYSEMMLDYNTIGTNYNAAEDVFVNPSQNDWRLKKNSEEAVNTKAPDEDFDMNQIGVDITKFTKNPILCEDFKLIYPQNGTVDIDTDTVTLTWQRPVGADCFRLVIAADKEMKNVVEEVYLYETNYTVNNLKNDSVYYWKVYAKNESIYNYDWWESKGVPYMFTTAKKNVEDTTDIDAAIMTAEEKLTEMEEGTQAGKYKEGTKKVLQDKIDTAKKSIGNEESSIEEKKNLVKDIENIINSDKFICGGYVNLGDFIEDETNWMSNIDGLTFNKESRELSVFNNDNDIVSGYVGMNEASRVMALSFKLKIDFNTIPNERENQWLAIGIRGQNPVSHVYSGGNDQYFIIIKEGMLEYQRNSGGSNKLIESIENNSVKNGEWVDVEFGVINLGDVGQLTILKINGDVVYQEVDSSEEMVLSKGCFQIEATKGVEAVFKAADKELPDFNELVDEYTFKMTENFCKEIEKENNQDTIILKSGSKIAYFNGKLSNIAEPVEGEEMLITLSTAASVFGGTSTGNSLTIDNKTFRFNNDSAVYEVNGKQSVLQKSAVYENGQIKISITDLTEILGKVLYNHNNLVFIADSIDMHTANFGEIINGASKALALYIE